MNDARPSSDETELDALLALMADERLSDDQAARLEKLIADDEQARSQYIEMASLCAELAWTCGGRSQTPTLDEPDRDQEQPILRIVRGTSQSAWGPLTAFAAGVAAATLLLAALGLLRRPGGNEEGPRLAQQAPANLIEEVPVDVPPLAATLTGLVDCRWVADIPAPTYGEPLQSDRLLKLESGLAQLTFESGAKLILQGPAEFLVRSDMQGTLNAGKLTAVVPQQAHGFTVVTPTAEVVDLGTEFGIQVDGDGRTEVHVFEGEVLSWQVGSRSNIEGEAVSLTKDTGAAFTIGAPMPRNVPAEPDKFVREIGPQLTERELPALPIKRNLALWLAADVLVKKDEQDRVIAWRDILAGDNQMGEDAWQHNADHRPLWVADAIGGKPALRFDGQSTSLVTTPLLTTKDQTLFFVFQRNSDSPNPDHMRQLINYNGPPYNLPDPSRSFRILQIDDRGFDGAYRAFVFAGWAKQRTVQFGKVRMNEPAAVGVPLVLTYTYDTTRNQAELIVNGVSQGVAPASSGLDIVSRKIIGKHPVYEGYFHGDMAEVLIFNAGLARDKMAQIERYLSEKYSITVTD